MRKRRSPNQAVKSIKPMEDTLGPGEVKVVAKVKMLLNYGRLAVKPGTVIVLGPEDRKQGINIDLLLRNRAVVPFESEEQAAKIGREGEEAGKERETVKIISSKVKRGRR